ncbi:MAG: hypothetical protein ISS26_06760 [Candidatus Omnitrophica bacterium]|nr:hypothetical protein [Candidatus Omnitrophota bacterium]
MRSHIQIKSRIYVLLALIIANLFLIAPFCDASFTWINKSSGLSGRKFTSIALDKKNSGTIYLGSEGGLYRSLDSGGSWKSIFAVPGSKAVNIIAVADNDPRTLYIATGSGIFKSVDSGENWRPCRLGSGQDNVLTVFIDLENSDTIYAGTESGIFVTKDAGENWARSSEGLSAVNIKAIAGNHIDRDILFAAADNGLFKSEDGAATWNKIFSENTIDHQEGDEYIEEELPIAPTWVSVDPFNPSIIYLVTERGIFKSENSGSSWKNMTETGLLDHNIKNLIIPSYDRGYMFISTDGGIFRFSDKENIWKEFYNGLDSKAAAFIAIGPEQDTLWLATENGVYKSEGDLYSIKEFTPAEEATSALQDFNNEPSYQEIQEVAIRYAEVHPDKIAAWRTAAKTKALLPKLSFSVDRDSSKGLHWDAGSNPDRWIIGPEDEKTGWDITCTWDLGDLIWNGDQTLIDVRSKLMVQLRDDVLDEVTHLYFARRKLQVELAQNPPKDTYEFIDKELRLQELTAGIDAMTGGYLTRALAK